MTASIAKIALITENGYEAGTAPAWVIRRDAVLKYFVEKQHAIHGAKATEAVQKFWGKLRYDWIENPDEYGVNLLMEGNGRKFGCEVEVKTG